MKTDKPQTTKQKIIENVTSLGVALLFVLMIRSSVIEAFKIPSGSMIPTLLVGDHIFVNKFAYGFILPFTDWILNDPVYLIKREQPKRGDIIVFKYPRDESIYYIKRVIGTPGDIIEMRNKTLYINGEEMKHTPSEQSKVDEVEKVLENTNYYQNSTKLFTEDLGVKKTTVMIDPENGLSDYFEKITVPPDHFFVMGDNRDASNDSRFWGFVPMKNVRGKALVIWLSLWISFENEEFIFRPTRSATILH